MKDGSLSQKKKEKSMNIIMHEALHYFEKNGYDNTTVEQLCQEAMISQSTFFNYFGTKEKVVEMIMEDGLKDFRECADNAVPETEPFARLKSSLDFQANAIEKYCNIVSVFLRLALQREEFRILEQKFIDKTGELILEAYDSAGRKCPYNVDMLKNLIGGYFIIPFFCYPPEEAGAHVRDTTNDFIKLLKNS